ncbi:MAG: hypothetical protein DMD43_02990 [Gemmatimonadetes bacterium]|nr:MAG: hypothetical protein DMD43_02990 [Gemmatimonadota bacterium]
MRIPPRYSLPGLVLLSACGTRPPSAAGPGRDSAGITVVESATPVAADSVAFRPDSAPAVDIGGGRDPHGEFAGIAGVARQSDGSIAVADRGSQEIRVFDSTGRWVRSLGRKGGGPGEFEALGQIFLLPGDSLAAYDFNHRRFSVFSPAGAVAREAALVAEGPIAYPQVTAVFPDGRLLVQGLRNFGPGAVSGVVRDTAPLAIYSPQGHLVDSLGRFPGAEYLVQASSGGLTARALPFSRSLRTALAGDRIFLGITDRYQIGEYTAQGKLERLIRRAHPDEPVTQADAAGYIEAQLQALPPARAKDREAMRQSLQQSPFPRVRPHFGGFIVARDGALWVREFEGYDTGRPARYAVFDRDGRWLGLASFPHGFTVYQAGSDFALGTVKDADDVEHVRLYRLRASRK